MSLTAFTLVVVGALLHAYWNVQMKRARGGVGLIWLFTLIAVAFLAPAGIYQLVETGSWSDVRMLLAAAASAIVHVVYHNALQLGYVHQLDRRGCHRERHCPSVGQVGRRDLGRP